MRLALFYWGATLCAQPGDPAAEAQRAKELMSAGQYEQAIPIYQRMVKAMPGNSGVLLNLALAEKRTEEGDGRRFGVRRHDELRAGCNDGSPSASTFGVKPCAASEAIASLWKRAITSIAPSRTSRRPAKVHRLAMEAAR